MRAMGNQESQRLNMRIAATVSTDYEFLTVTKINAFFENHCLVLKMI